MDFLMPWISPYSCYLLPVPRHDVQGGNLVPSQWEHAKLAALSPVARQKEQGVLLRPLPLQEKQVRGAAGWGVAAGRDWFGTFMSIGLL